jgi:hypothetical protein
MGACPCSISLKPRGGQALKSVTLRAEQFPTEHKDRCFQYLGRFGSRLGTFDFIEDDEGQITFLECNANGQYKWLEQSLGFPISTAIVSELAAIAGEN